MVDNPVREGLPNDLTGAVGLPSDAEVTAAQGRSLQVWLAVGILVVAFGLSHAPLFVYFWQRWTEEHGPFGYGYFVPPCVVYLLWANRKDIASAPTEPSK